MSLSFAQDFHQTHLFEDRRSVCEWWVLPTHTRKGGAETETRCGEEVGAFGDTVEVIRANEQKTASAFDRWDDLRAIGDISHMGLRGLAAVVSLALDFVVVVLLGGDDKCTFVHGLTTCSHTGQNVGLVISAVITTLAIACPRAFFIVIGTMALLPLMLI